MKKIHWVWWVLTAILAIGVALMLLRSNEDTWIKNSNGNWVKHGNPSAPMPQ